MVGVPSTAGRRAGAAVLLRLSLAVALIAPAGAQAASPWLAPAVVLEPAGLIDHQVAFDPHGTAVAVWRRGAVVAARRPAGGIWSAPETLSAPITDGQRNQPELALDPEGNALVIWHRDGVVQVASRRAGATTWDPPLDLGPGVWPSVAFDAQGGAVAVWRDDSGQVQGANWSPGGEWDTTKISDSGASVPQVAVGSEGDAMVVWSSAKVVRAVARPAGGPWGQPQDISLTGQEISHEYAGHAARYAGPEVGVDGQGNAVVVWGSAEATADSPEDVPFEDSLPDDQLGDTAPVTEIGIVRARTYDAGQGSWAQAQELSVSGQSAEEPRLAVDPQGHAVIVWKWFINPFNNVIQARSYDSVQKSWSAPQNVSSPQGNATEGIGNVRPEHDVAIDSQGNSTALWRRVEGNDTALIEAASRPKEGAWSAPHNVSGGGEQHQAPSDTRLALDGQGNGVAMWTDSNGTRRAMQAAGYDAAGPQLRDLSVPGTATARSALSFSVGPVDVWSSIKSTRWDFGDGASATGNSVLHTFAAPGSYKVTVTATDSLDNVSAPAERTVTIAGATGGGGEAGGAETGSGGTGTGTGTGGLTPGTGPPPSGSGDDGAGPAAGDAKRIRARRFRRCVRLAKDRRSQRARRLALRRCAARYGRTPGRVKRLEARGAARKVVLTFRAPGTDGSREPAARAYLVRQSTTPIRGRRGFRRAQTLCNASCRFDVTDAGSKITLTITDLRPNTTYYYAVAARDNVSRRLGPRSRVVKARTR